MRLQGFLGILVFLGISWVLSENRKHVRYTTMPTGVIIQFSIAGILLYVPFLKRFFLILNSVVLALEAAIKAGTSFVFGYTGGDSRRFCSGTREQTSSSSPSRLCPSYS